ncbi:hypothetical protein SAY86_032213 [Trapa natans]|uniref:Uncharacterized protein n=1 Tax=Trapa natans TaxID=22666 RepID=A0AAN7M8S1_TRANT|nr:hypothetical protein SAY86_032213 [Trapa natans]
MMSTLYQKILQTLHFTSNCSTQTKSLKMNPSKLCGHTIFDDEHFVPKKYSKPSTLPQAAQHKQNHLIWTVLCMRPPRQLTPPTTYFWPLGLVGPFGMSNPSPSQVTVNKSSPAIWQLIFRNQVPLHLPLLQQDYFNLMEDFHLRCFRHGFLLC